MVKDFQKIKISPSILSLPLEKISENLQEIQEEIDFVHIDVMDGKFVTNETNGLEMFHIAKKSCNLPMDVHLMVENPMAVVSDYLGADIITFHREAVETIEEAKQVLKKIKSLGAKAGISIKPNTSVTTLNGLLEAVDLILIMTVEPGYGGQKWIPETLLKIEKLRNIGFTKWIEVDGGIHTENAKLVKEKGADILVAGTAIFSASDKQKVIEELKGNI